MGRGERWELSSGLGAATIALATATVIGKVATFAQEGAVAAIFGATRNVDVIVTARLIPSFVSGAISAPVAIGLVPIVQGLLKNESLGSLRAVIRLTLIASAAMMAAAAAATLSLGGVILPAIAPGYAEPERALVSHLMYAAFPIGLLDAWGVVLLGILQAQGRFRLGALVSVAAALIGVTSVVVLGRLFGIWGVMAGWGIGSGTQVVSLLSLNRLPPVNSLSPPMQDVRRMVVAAFPVIVLALVANVVTFVDRALSSQLGSGAVAIINWAQKVYNLPIGLAIVPLATAAYPFLTGDRGSSQRTENRVALSIAALLFATLPASWILLVLRADIASVLFVRGGFSESDAARLGGVIGYYAIGLAFIGGFTVLTRIAYGLGHAWSPVIAASIGSLAYVPLARFCTGALGLSGLGLAYSLAMFVSTVSLVGLMVRGRALSFRSVLGAETIKVAFASLGMGAVMVWSHNALREATPWITVLATGGLGCVTFWLLCRAFRSNIQRRIVAVALGILPKESMSTVKVQ